MHINTAYVGVGTNLGDRIQNLIDARLLLSELLAVHSLRSSAFYVTSPVGYAEQADFLNCVFEIEFSGEADALFRHMQSIEQKLGRVRDPDNQNAPRVIDLDLLLFENEQNDSSELTLPHPRISERLFVLYPLLELNPELAVEGFGSLAEMMQNRQSQGYYADQQVHKLGA